MRRICCFSLLAATFAVSVLLGCGQQTAGPDPETQPINLVVKPDPKPRPGPGKVQPGKGQPDAKQPDWVEANFGADDDQTHYENAIQEAFGLLGDKKYTDALASLEAAAKFKDTEFVQIEIKKLRLRIDKQNAA